MLTRTRPPQLAEAFADFCQRYPAYTRTAHIDALRTRDYRRLDRLGHTYLDYTGGSLYAESQLQAHLALLQNNVFGNPHSENLTSRAMTELVEQARRSVLTFFNADPAEYAVIFTANATAALKLVGEAYPFTADSHYALTYDNHNSVNGIREYAHTKGAQVSYIPLLPPDLRADAHRLREVLQQGQRGAANLLAYPAQSNFSGVQHPLEWIAEAQALGWDVLLDAAAFAPTNRLDLQRWQPDYVDLSFYKIFGYPTGIGCLQARHAALDKLQRPWYAGGTVTCASVQGENYYRTPGAAGFEDGTVNYLSLPAVEIGLRHMTSISLDALHTRVLCLTGWLLDELTALHHDNGQPVLRVYGPTTTEGRGGTVEVNFYDPSGQLIDCRRIETLANAQRISLRAGCHCNPGAREISLGISLEEINQCLLDSQRMTFDQFLQVVGEKSTGAVRASLGIASNFADVYRYVQFAREFSNRPLSSLGGR